MQLLFEILIIFLGFFIIHWLLKREINQGIEKLISQNKDLDAQKFLDLQGKLLENFTFFFLPRTI